MGSDYSTPQICRCSASGDLPYEVHDAARNGYLTKVSNYLKTNDNVNAMYSGKTMLHTACENGRFNVVEKLLSHRNICMNLRTKNKNVDTALILASRNGHLDCVKALLPAKTQCPLDIESKNSYGNKALDDALVYKREEVVFLLMATTKKFSTSSCN
nr:caskin-1-like isoform X2 [Cherax quadricarinatus]